MDWSKYPNFNADEFNCTHTGKNEMKPDFMEKLQELRNLYGKAMTITSGYRDVTHPVEAKKAQGGVHTMGIACDVSCNGSEAFLIMKYAQLVGFTGIGVSQKGNGRFIHLDTHEGTPRPNIWSY